MRPTTPQTPSAAPCGRRDRSGGARPSRRRRSVRRAVTRAGDGQASDEIDQRRGGTRRGWPPRPASSSSAG
ncbi:MAG: hypothetical protein MZV64_22955 [Ignavibacteriales bacterium]|nr:hypothetical protein [Ignavibacteriales bacterium]